MRGRDCEPAIEARCPGDDACIAGAAKSCDVGRQDDLPPESAGRCRPAQHLLRSRRLQQCRREDRHRQRPHRRPGWQDHCGRHRCRRLSRHRREGGRSALLLDADRATRQRLAPGHRGNEGRAEGCAPLRGHGCARDVRAPHPAPRRSSRQSCEMSRTTILFSTAIASALTMLCLASWTCLPPPLGRPWPSRRTRPLRQPLAPKLRYLGR